MNNDMTLFERTMKALRGEADSMDYEWMIGFETEGTAADIVELAKDHDHEEAITEEEAQTLLDAYRERFN